MLSEHQTAKACYRGERRNEHSFAGAAGKDTRMLFFSKAVEDVNAVGHTNANNERKGHDVGGIKWDIEKAHHAQHPNSADGDGNEGEHNARDFAEMNEDQNRDGNSRVPRCLLETVFQQSGIFIELHRGSCDFRINRAKVLDEFLLFFALPHIFFRIDLNEEFAMDSNETAAQRVWQIDSTHRTAVILVFDRVKGLTDIIEEGLLKIGELLRYVDAVLHEHAPANLDDGAA